MSENKNEKNVILNESEENLLMNHDYDGIQEFDYPLPSWWSWIFIGTLIFGVFYLYFYTFADGKSLMAEYETEYKKVVEIRTVAQAKLDNFDEDKFNAWVAVNDGVNKGKEVFMDNCAACHTETGAGDIGPNLTDSYWIHMKTVTPGNIFKVVKNGVIDKGMPVWSETLNKDEIFAATAYVFKVLHNKNVANGKEPQGEKATN